MAFLKDLGSTNQLAVSTSNLANLALGMRRADTADKQLAMEKETHDVQLAVNKAQLEKIQKEEAFNNQVLTLDQVFSSNPAMNSPSVKKRLLDLAGPAIQTDAETGVQSITRRELGRIQQGIVQDIGFQKVLDEDYLRDLVSQKNQIIQQLNDPNAKLKPEQVQQVQQQLGGIEKNISEILTNRPILDRAIAEQDAKIKLMEAQTQKEKAMAGLYGAKEANVGKGGAGGVGGNTSFERAYAEFVANNPDQPMDRATFRQTKWLAQRDGAPLSDATAIENLKGLVDYDSEKFKVGYSEYVKLRKSGISSTEALDKVSQKLSKPQLAPMTDQTVPSHTSSGAAQKDYIQLLGIM